MVSLSAFDLGALVQPYKRNLTPLLLDKAVVRLNEKKFWFRKVNPMKKTEHC